MSRVQRFSAYTTGRIEYSMRRYLCVQALPRLRTTGCKPRSLSAAIHVRQLTTGNKPSRRNECTAAAPYNLSSEDVSETRPFAVERVGGRECHISWSSERGSGIEKEWRDIGSETAEEGKIAAPTNSFTGRISSWLGQMFLPTNYPESVHPS